MDKIFVALPAIPEKAAQSVRAKFKPISQAKKLKIEIGDNEKDEEKNEKGQKEN